MPTRRDRAVLLRRVCVLEGRGNLDVDLLLRAEYGDAPMGSIRRHDDGSWSAESGAVHLRWSGAPNARVVDDASQGDRLSFRIDLDADAQHDLVLELGAHDIGECLPDPDRLWALTEQHWKEAVPDLHGVVAHRGASMPTQCSPDSPQPAAGWWLPRPADSPNVRPRGGATTTATSGSATSASPVWPSPR